VLPEKFVGVTPESSSAVMDVFTRAARTARVTVIAGVSRNAVQPRHNIALVFFPDGTSPVE
jgi:hypothetical protein